MKKVNQKLSLLLLGSAIIAASIVSSCSKSSNNNNTPPPPKPPSNPGNYDSSAQIASGNLVAYFPFNGSYNDVKQGLTGTNHGASFSTGIKGQDYHGSGNSYVTFSNAGTLGTLTSFTMSVWVKQPAQPINDTTPNYIAGQGAQGLLFMYDTATSWNLLHLDFEPFTPVSKDSLRVHAGFNSTGATAYQGIVPEMFIDSGLNNWFQFVFTYNGASSEFTVYKNGVAISATSAWGYKPTPYKIWTDGSATTPFGNINYKNPPQGFVLGAFPQAVTPTISTSIGGPQPWSGNLQGAMDELRIYNSALNAVDVNSLYLLEKAGF